MPEHAILQSFNRIIYNKLQDLLHLACMYIRGVQLDNIFQSDLNFVNLMCQMVKISNI